MNKKNCLKVELTEKFQFQFSWYKFNGAQNFVITFSTWKTFSTLPQKRTDKNVYCPKSKQSMKSDVFYCMRCLFSAILCFWRRKFEHDPVVTLTLNVQFLVLNGFPTQFCPQNRIHVSKLKNYHSKISCLSRHQSYEFYTIFI